MLLLLLLRGPPPLRSEEDAGRGVAGRLSPPSSLGPHGGGGRRAPAPRFGGADGSWSTRQGRRTGEPGPHGYPPLSDSPPKPSSPAFGASGAKAGHSGPPRPGGPVRSGPAAAALQAAGRGAARPLDSPARLGPGEGMSVPAAGLGAEGGAYPWRARPTRGSMERSQTLTVDARKIKIRGEGAWSQSQGSRTRRCVQWPGAGETGGLVGKGSLEAALPPTTLAAGRGVGTESKMPPTPAHLNSL